MFKKGSFVSIYGVDGTGKTTVVNELQKRFFKEKNNFLNFDQFEDKKLNNPYVLSKKSVIKYGSENSQFFHYIGSNIFQGDIISRFKEDGKFVVKSRWFLDIFAAFSYRGLDFIEDLKTKIPFLIPDVSVLLVVDEIERISRIRNRKTNNLDDFDLEKVNYKKEYLRQSLKEKIYNEKNFLEIDTTNKNPGEIADIILDFCKKLNE